MAGQMAGPEHILRNFLDSTNDKVGGVSGMKVPRGPRVVADPGFKFGRGKWRARGARAYNGGLGQSPQRGPGAEPLVGGQGANL